MNTNKISFAWNSLNSYSPQEVTYLFTNIRVFLEKENLKNSLPTLNLYCNWLVHSELDRSSCKLISTLKAQISEHFNLGNDFNLAMSQVLSITKLKDELRSVLLSCQITPNEQDADWKKLLTTLFVELTDKPLRCTSLTLDNESTHPYDFYGVKLVEYEGQICWELLSPSLEKIESRIIGPLISIKSAITCSA